MSKASLTRSRSFGHRGTAPVGHETDMPNALREVRFKGDCVAKIFSQRGHKFSVCAVRIRRNQQICDMIASARLAETVGSENRGGPAPITRPMRAILKRYLVVRIDPRS